MVKSSRVGSQEAVQSTEKALYFILSVNRRCHRKLTKLGCNIIGTDEDPHDFCRRKMQGNQHQSKDSHWQVNFGQLTASSPS